MDLEAYLSSKGVRVRRSGNQLHVPCMFCGEDPNKRGRLYIDDASEDTRGLFFCHLCQERGNLRTLQRYFGDEVDVASDHHHGQHRAFQEAAKFYADNLHPDVFGWLKRERHLTSDTIIERQLGWAPSEDPTALFRHLRSCGIESRDILATGLCVERNGSVKDFLQAKVTIPYRVQGSVVQIRGKDMNGKYVTPPNQKARLFNTDALLDAPEVAITEGEFDAMVLAQLGFAAVGVPGASSWQERWVDYFADAKVVYVVFDPDEVGQRGAHRVREAIGHRAKVVDLPVPEDVDPKEVDPTFLLGEGLGLEDFEGFFRTSVLQNSILITVDEAFQEWQSVQGMEGVALGFEELDARIKPGLLPAQVCVILAKTGSGKTLSLLNVFHRAVLAQPDLKILFVSLEQTRGDWFERARRILNFYDLDIGAADLPKHTLDFWRPHLELVDKNRVTESELIGCIDEYEMRKGAKPDLVAVDYLGYWAGAFKGRDRYDRVSEAIMSLKAVAKEKMVAVLAPHQVNRSAEFGQELEIDQARESGVIEETGDFVLTLWSPDSMKGVEPQNRTGVVNLKVGKSRHGGTGQIVKLQFAPLTLAMVPIEDKLRVRYAKDELRYVMQGDTWEHAIKRHRTGIQDLGMELDPVGGS